MIVSVYKAVGGYLRTPDKCVFIADTRLERSISTLLDLLCTAFLKMHLNCVILLLCVSNAPVVNASCEPCVCLPNAWEAKYMYCEGTDVTAYPALVEEIKGDLEAISIYNTFIICLPPISGPSEYPRLRSFSEKENVLWQCDCLGNWIENAGEKVVFVSDCDVANTTFPSSTPLGDITSTSTAEVEYTSPSASTSGSTDTPTTPSTEHQVKKVAIIATVMLCILLLAIVLPAVALRGAPQRVIRRGRTRPLEPAAGGSGGGGGGLENINYDFTRGAIDNQSNDYVDPEELDDVELWSVTASRMGETSV